MGIPEELILTGNELALPPGLVDRFGEHTPLWYYILREAEVLAGGRKLGPIGGRIVAEVILGLLHGDPFSFLNMSPNWTPTRNRFGADADGNFTIPDLLRFARVKIKDEIVLPEREVT
jgi:hypothetical protein